MRSGSVLTAPSFSSPGRGVSTRPGPPKRSSRCQAAPVWGTSHVVGEKPPYARRGRPGVQWEGCWPCCTFPGTSHEAHRCQGGWRYTLPGCQTDPLPWGITGYQWQIVQTRLKVDAQLDPPALMCATLTIRLSLTASSPHPVPGYADRNPTD